MSESLPIQIIDRISVATTDSPIAVFRCNTPRKLNAVFFNTIGTRKLIGNDQYIGTFDRTDDMRGILATLDHCVRLQLKANL